MTLKKAAVFALTLIFLLCNVSAMFAAASDGSYTLDYNVLRKIVEF